MTSRYQGLFPSRPQARDKALGTRLISNTRDSISSTEDTTHSGVFSDEIRGVWIAGKTLFSLGVKYIFSIENKTKL